MKNRIIGNRKKGRLEELMRKAGQDPVIRDVLDGKKVIANMEFEKLFGEDAAEYHSIAFRPPGTHLVVGADEKLFSLFISYPKKWTVLDKKIQRPKDKIEAVACSPDGRYVVCGRKDGAAVFYTGNLVSRSMWAGDVKYKSMAFGKKRIFIASGSGHLRVFKFENDLIEEIGKEKLYPECIDVFDRFLACYSDGALRIYDAMQNPLQDLVAHARLDGIEDLSFINEKHILCAHKDDYVKAYEIKRNGEIKQIGELKEKANRVTCYGDYVAVTGYFDALRFYKIKKNAK